MSKKESNPQAPKGSRPKPPPQPPQPPHYPQSLEAHDREVAARALELFAAKYHGKRHHEFVIREIVHEVEKLRAGGEKG